MQKRKSENCLAIQLQEFKPYQTGTEKLMKIKEEYVNEELYFTKMPTNHAKPKSRKFSTNNNNKEPFVQNHFSKALVYEKKEEKKIQISQLTAATIDENKKKENSKTLPQTPQSPPLNFHKN